MTFLNKDSNESQVKKKKQPKKQIKKTYAN